MSHEVLNRVLCNIRFGSGEEGRDPKVLLNFPGCLSDFVVLSPENRSKTHLEQTGSDIGKGHPVPGFRCRNAWWALINENVFKIISGEFG